MGNKGLQVIENPSAFFLKERKADAAGSAVVCTIKGSRPLLVEIQALVSSTLFTGNPRRMTIGLDHFRTAMLLAIAEKKLGFSFAGEDVYLNVAGGISVDEPAMDLGTVVAVVSCIKNKIVPSHMTFFGEIGLSGEIRSVGHPLSRVKESGSLGFKNIILPRGNLAHLEKEKIPDVELVGVQSLKEALGIIF
jgi:DNA repair protein RadA/Sms